MSEKSYTDILRKELWDGLCSDGGENIRELLALKKREDRRGRVKRLLGRAIRESSLGVFGGKMYHFGGKTYVPVERQVLHSILYDIMANMIEMPDADLVKLSDIYMDCCNVVYSKQLVVSNNIMIFRNGVLDVEKNSFSKKFDKKFIQMWSVDYDYVPEVKTFLWHQFINQVLPDKYWQEALQMFLGATFIDRKKVKIEHIMILLGKGANGKSVIQQAVCGVLGEEYVSQHEIGRLCSRGNEGDLAVAEINGKRLNYCTEMEETDFYKKSARLKAIVSGENVTARQLYGNPFKAMNIPLLMANANMLPIFNKKDEAMLRRIYVVPFNVTIPLEKQNKTLGDELVDEYPAILNWILEGRDKFIKNGYRLPEDSAVDKFINDERTEYSTVLKFLKIHRYSARIEGVEVAPLVWVRCIELYNDYKRWCQNNRLDFVGKTVFSHILINDCGFVRNRRNSGYCFAVYGTHLETMRKTREAKARSERKTKGPALLWYNGVAYARSLKDLGNFCGVALNTVRRVRYQGNLEPFIRANGNGKYVYDAMACMEEFKRLHIIATDAEKEIQKRFAMARRDMRTSFNMRMKTRGWPYRMYEGEYDTLEEDIVKVPDYITDEEIMEKAAADGFDTSKIRGAYGFRATRILEYKEQSNSEKENGKEEE